MNEIPIQTVNEELEKPNESSNSPEQYENDKEHQAIIPVLHINPMTNCNHDEEEDRDCN